jgi:hypothetical protein
LKIDVTSSPSHPAVSSLHFDSFFCPLGNSGVHVKPEMGSAVYFSYIDPATLVTDNGFTEHSGCPVLKGEKKIVTQWIRRGVDDANPWDSFNTLGIKKSEARESD